jgi:hypothetical protein
MTASPQYSPDGRWYWDGQRWQPVVAPGPAWSRPYAPVQDRAAAVIALVIAALAGSAVLAGIDVLVVVAVPPNDTVRLEVATLQLVASVGWVAGLVGAVVASAMWMHRAFRNLPALGATNLRWSPAWAAGGWFIPVANLVIPYLVARELWRATNPPEPRILLEGWWAAWVLGLLLFVFNFVISQFNLIAALVLDVPYRALVMVAGLLFIAIVRAVTSRQRARHAELVARA